MNGHQATIDDSSYDDGVFSAELRPRNVLSLALAVESGLLLAAVVGGWWFGFTPWPGFSASLTETATAVFSGAAAGILLTAAGIGLERLPGRALAEYRRYVRTQIAPLFADCSTLTLALIAIAAGVGEEVFFRGFLQQGLSLLQPGNAGVAAALVIAAVLFGVCHSLTRLYFVLATIGGLLFGGLYLWTGHLATPMTAHALYDFLILLYLVRRPAAE